MIRDTPAGVEFEVRVTPRANKTQIGVRDNTIIARVAAPPVEGAANDALIRLLSETFDVPRGAIRILSGERSRLKRISISGVTAAQIRALVG